jgi:hypothetical protein
VNPGQGVKKENYGNISALKPPLPGYIAGLRATDVGQLTETEPVRTGGVRVSVYRHPRETVWDIKRLTDLLIHLKVLYGTPESLACHR